MASWVGTAKTLIGLKDQWQGTLMFIAQPAEETVSGAKAMLADGIFTRFKKPDFGFALHDGAFGYGNVLYRVGIGSSNQDSLYIKIRGRGGGGAGEEGGKGRIGQKVKTVAAGPPRGGFSQFRHRGGGVDGVQHGCLGAGGGGRGKKGRGPATGVQPFAAVRAGAETDHR